jgi:ParB family chromosome partitioning protein
MSVRETEQLVKRLQNPSEKEFKDPGVDPNVLALQKALSDKFAAPVLIQYNSKGKGKLIIHFNSIDEFDGILQHLQ